MSPAAIITDFGSVVLLQRHFHFFSCILFTLVSILGVSISVISGLENSFTMGVHEKSKNHKWLQKKILVLELFIDYSSNFFLLAWWQQAEIQPLFLTAPLQLLTFGVA